MTVNDLPEKLRQPGVQMYTPGQKFKAKLKDEDMAALEHAFLLRMLDEKEKEQSA